MEKLTFLDKWNKLNEYPVRFKKKVLLDHLTGKSFIHVDVLNEDGVNFGCFNDQGGSGLYKYEVFDNYGGSLPTEVKLVLQG